MNAIDVLRDLFDRVATDVHGAVEGLDEAALTHRVGGASNSIAWLVWHLTRVQDHHISELVDVDQRYLADGFHERFGRGPDPQDHGYGHTAADVASVRASAADLLAYYDAVHARTIDYLSDLTPTALDQVVDEAWDPPVTLGVRLASLVSDCLQHAGQAAYARGILTG
jgi:uncharacterized damage-inducible protein DinB